MLLLEHLQHLIGVHRAQALLCGHLFTAQMEGNWPLWCRKEAVGFCLWLCNHELRFWAVAALFISTCACFVHGVSCFYGSGVCNQFQKYQQYSLSPWDQEWMCTFKKALKEKKHFKSSINSIHAVEDRHSKALFFHWVKHNNEESKLLYPVPYFSLTSIWRQTSAFLPFFCLL